MTFDFYGLSPEQAEQLRQDRATCIVYLHQSVDLAAKLTAIAGIYTPLDEQDERELQNFHYVCQAYENIRYAGEFEELCTIAGLSENDAALLAGRIETLFMQRKPDRYMREAAALIYGLFGEDM